MKTRFLSAIVVFLLLAAPVACRAWGPEGHMVVAMIAEHYLTPEARHQVNQILGGDHLDDNRVANWPDFIRGNKSYDEIYPGNHAWHYIDIDIKTPAAKYALPPDGNDVVDQVVRWQKELAEPTNTVERRRDALRFLVHFTADVHQPLHCAFRDDDRGGNLLFLHSFHGDKFVIDEETARERTLNLHKAWDEYLVYETISGLSFDEFAEMLIHGIKAEDAAAWKTGAPKSWAWESHELAVAHAYRFTDGSPLPEADDGKPIDLTDANYIAGNVLVVREQLQKAGVRLAMLINDALHGP